jgi:hypothetical protein
MKKELYDLDIAWLEHKQYDYARYTQMKHVLAETFQEYNIDEVYLDNLAHQAAVPTLQEKRKAKIADFLAADI